MEIQSLLVADEFYDNWELCKTKIMQFYDIALNISNYIGNPRFINREN